MKKKIPISILLVLLSLTLCSCIDSTTIKAILEEMGTYKARKAGQIYTDADQGGEDEAYTGNGSAWCSELFKAPSTSYDKALALAAAEMSDKAENDAGDDTTIRELYSAYSLYACEYHGFDGVNAYESYGGAFAIGQDTLTIDGVDTTILVVTARGTKNLREGVGDIFKGGQAEILGTKVWYDVYDFYRKIWKAIDDYIMRYPAIQEKEDLKILITGHSLGGAAANLVGARFTDGVGKDGWWGRLVSKEDIYVYTFGAIKVLTTEENISDGYENIHNIYNYYDSYGPNGNQKGTNASSLNAKFGHTDLYYLLYDENGPYLWSSCNSHQMANYKEALEKMADDGDFIKLVCSGEKGPCQEETVAEMPTASGPESAEDVSPDRTPEEDLEEGLDRDFTIEGAWKSVGTYGFGQAQPGTIVAFDGMHCNFYSPYDTYAFYQEDGQWKLECTSFLFSETLSFTVEVIHRDRIHIYFSDTCTELERID